MVNFMVKNLFFPIFCYMYQCVFHSLMHFQLQELVFTRMNILVENCFDGWMVFGPGWHVAQDLEKRDLEQGFGVALEDY